MFSTMTLYSMPSTIVTLLLSGYYVDIVKPIYLIAPAFLCRSLSTYSFKFVQDPEGALAYILVSLLLVTTTVMVVSLESAFMKSLPADARGAMLVLLTFFMGIGALLFNGVGGPIFDGLGPSSPFILVSILDMIFFVLAIILSCLGYLSTFNADHTKLGLLKKEEEKYYEHHQSSSNHN